MGITGLPVLYDEIEYYTETGSLMSAEQFHHHDEDDVLPALSRATQDGSGFENEEELPESDFEGFAGDDVEMTEEDPK